MHAASPSRAWMTQRFWVASAAALGLTATLCAVLALSGGRPDIPLLSRRSGASSGGGFSFEGTCGVLEPPGRHETGVPACTGGRLPASPPAEVTSLATCAAWCASVATRGCCLLNADDGCSVWDGLPTRVPHLPGATRSHRNHEASAAATLLCNDAPEPSTHDPAAPLSSRRRHDRALTKELSAVRAAPSDGNVCSNGTCTTCAACCKPYIPNGPACDDCAKASCPALVCWPQRKCTACPQCCRSYLQEDAACSGCVKDTGCTPPPSPSPTPKAPSNCRWRCHAQFIEIPRCGWECGGKL